MISLFHLKNLGLINHDHVTQYDFEGRYRCFAYQEIYEVRRALR